MENFPYIPFVPDKGTVIRRMGSQKAFFSSGIEDEINICYKDAGSLFAAKGRAGIFDFQKVSGSISINGTMIESQKMSKLLCNSTKAYLMCAAIPQSDLNVINDAMINGQGLKALVLDAYASEYVDGALDVIMKRKNADLKRVGQKLTKNRFSAGYGDLDIKYQKVFYDMLEMQSLDVSLNDRYLLIPEKSVIAIAGVE